MSFTAERMFTKKAFWGAGVFASALMVLPLITPANAFTMRLGEVDLQIDNIVSAGVSVRVSDRETDLLPARNGGPKDRTLGIDGALLGAYGVGLTGGSPVEAQLDAALDCGTQSAPSVHARNAGSTCMYDGTFLGMTAAALTGSATVFSARAGELAGYGRELFNYDSSINTDDGRLNFDNGDLTGGTLKLTTELEASWQNITAFARINAFYDAVLNASGSYERSGLGDTASRAVGGDIDLLDLYVDIDLQPVFLRVGRQVINWGEATFILGGNSVFNPINVPAFRRPGAEIKEALLPVEAIYGSIALPYDLTLEAYYGFWSNYVIDAAGTPYSNSDSFEGVSLGNGYAGSYVGSGAYSGANKRNCDPDRAIINPADGMPMTNPQEGTVVETIADAVNAVFEDCAVDSPTDYLTANAAGNVEASRQRIRNVVKPGGVGDAGYVLGDTDFLSRGQDSEPKDFDNHNYGLALRWYAEMLGSTEFALYYQNYTSRLPYASSIARQPIYGPNVTAPTSSLTSRAFPLAGCALSFGTGFVPAGDPDNPSIPGVPSDDFKVADPTGVGAAFRDLFAAGSSTRTAIVAAAAANLHTRLAGMSPGASAVMAGVEGAVTAALGAPDNSFRQSLPLGCVGAYAQSVGGGNYLPTGSVAVLPRYVTEIVAEYPRDIRVIGASFNTTLFGWGMQGEVTYRPNMPLQLDTDAVAIAALSASCAWAPLNTVGFGDATALGGNLYERQTIKTQCSQIDRVFPGYAREEVYNVNLGTTATFTRSNPVISLLQADLGILLTEVGYIYFPDADHYKNEARYAADAIAPLQSLCTSGSDLPLKGIFALDPRQAEVCRPTEHSVGAVLFAQLQYNNVFGTAIGLRPSIAYNRGLYGMSPRPAGTWVEDNGALNVRLSAEYQADWTASIGYTMYHGDVLYNRNIDRDQVSINVSYAF